MKSMEEGKAKQVADVYENRAISMLESSDKVRKIADFLFHADSVEQERNRIQESLCKAEIELKVLRERVSEAMIILRDRITSLENFREPVQVVLGPDNKVVVFQDFIISPEDRLAVVFEAVLRKYLCLFEKETKELAWSLADAARQQGVLVE